MRKRRVVGRIYGMKYSWKASALLTFTSWDRDLGESTRYRFRGLAPCLPLAVSSNLGPIVSSAATVVLNAVSTVQGCLPNRKFVFSPDVILCGWVGSKHQLTKLLCLEMMSGLVSFNNISRYTSKYYWAFRQSGLHKVAIIILVKIGYSQGQFDRLSGCSPTEVEGKQLLPNQLCANRL